MNKKRFPHKTHFWMFVVALLIFTKYKNILNAHQPVREQKNYGNSCNGTLLRNGQQWTANSCNSLLLSRVVVCRKTWDDNKVFPGSVFAPFILH